MKVLDLFAGAGGFALGFKNAGYKIKTAIEVDKWACDTLRQNFKNTNVIEDSVEKIIKNKNFINKLKKHDIIIGGPPCQGYSLCRRGKGEPGDPRNKLVYTFFEYIKLIRPKFFIMENVANLYKAKNKKGELVQEILREEAEKLGYSFYIKVLNAAEFGVPQNRKRTFIVGSLIELKNPFPKPTHNLNGNFDLKKTPTLYEAIADLPELNSGEGAESLKKDQSKMSSYSKLMNESCKNIYNHKAMKHTKRVIERFKNIKSGQSVSDVKHEFKPIMRNTKIINNKTYDQNNRRLFYDKPSNTITASFYANFVHPKQNRNFTAREGARVQSFPDNFLFLGKPTLVSKKLLQRENRTAELHLCQYNQIGNAVPPLLAMHLAKNLVKKNRN